MLDFFGLSSPGETNALLSMVIIIFSPLLIRGIHTLLPQTEIQRRTDLSNLQPHHLGEPVAKPSDGGRVGCCLGKAETRDDDVWGCINRGSRTRLINLRGLYCENNRTTPPMFCVSAENVPDRPETKETDCRHAGSERCGAIPPC